MRQPGACLSSPPLEEQPVTPPVPEYLSPLRWRWILLSTRHRAVRFLYWPPLQPTGYRNLRVFDRDGYDIGRLVWVVCDACHGYGYLDGRYWHTEPTKK